MFHFPELCGLLFVACRLQMRIARQTGDVAVKVPNACQSWLSVTESTIAGTTTTRIQNDAVRRLSLSIHTVLGTFYYHTTPFI